MGDERRINLREGRSGGHHSDTMRQSKIDIKEMCKKFESASCSKSANCKEKYGPSQSAIRGAAPAKPVTVGTRSRSIPNEVTMFYGRNSDQNGFASSKTPSSENFNIVAKTGSACVGDIPIAPVRKNRTKSQSFGNEYIRTETQNDRTCTNSSVDGVSVKERTKLFEVGPSHNINSSVSTYSYVNKPCLNGKSRSSVFSPNVSENSVNKNSSEKEKIHDSSSFPPSKPPRTPFCNKLSKGFLQSCEKEGKPCVPQRSAIKEKYNAFFVPADQKKEPESSNSNGSPSSHKYESIENNTSFLSRLQSAPLQVIRDDVKDNTSKVSRKAQFFNATKPQTLLNYFKNLSGTPYMSEKVKPKVFVDLTPTTVSPPKHHDTLKRSYSEEHIYAELQLDPKSLQEEQAAQQHCSSEVSPYMTTTVVTEPALPKVPNSENRPSVYGNRKSLLTTKETKFGLSVRNMIYQSFLSLRNVDSSKEGSSGMQDDSGSDVSAQDVRERIIYVKSVKKQTSVSSICAAQSLFETLFVVSMSGGQPEVVLKFPKKPKRRFDYPLIPHLCFPDFHLLKPVSAYRSETFNFTLIDGNDEKMFGYCHRILAWPHQNSKMSFNFPCAICILTDVWAPILYKKLLSEVEKHLILPMKQFENYLSALKMNGIPNAGASLSVPDDTEGYQNARVVISRPLDCHTVSHDFTRILQLLDIEILLKAVSSLILERRVLLLSKYSKDLFQCCKALSSLLYPFDWQHLIIPVLPKCLLVQCCTETPYLLGIISSNHAEILDLLTEHDILIIDIDKAYIIKSRGDENTILPKKVHKALVMALNLAKNMTDPTEMLRDCMISEAFVRVFVETVGHYGEFLSPKDSTSTFQKEAFQRKPSSRSIQSFLEWFSETQMFDSFIGECLWRIKYREICQSHQLTFFEKRVEEYKWELTYDHETLSQIIGKTMKNFGEKLKILKAF